jgi:ubiquinone/menaquinone biosynthesis C-methylase UbiE
MNTEIFTGKAEAYAKARPGYPDVAIDYIASLMPKDAVIADVGAGTGKFTVLLAQRGYRVFAVEPNVDMRSQLASVLLPYPNATIVDGCAETTNLPDHSVDVVTCAQALHWFNADTFRAECCRITRNATLVITVYNNTPGGSSIAHSKLSTDIFYENPTVQEFPNPMYYTRESWLAYMTSHSHDPLPSDLGFAAHIQEMNAVFDREQVDGLIRRDVMTKVYSEVLK